MNVMLHDRVVVDAVAFFQHMSVLSVVYFDFSIKDIDELLAFMSRVHESFLFARLDV